MALLSSVSGLIISSSFLGMSSNASRFPSKFFTSVLFSLNILRTASIILLAFVWSFLASSTTITIVISRSPSDWNMKVYLPRLMLWSSVSFSCSMVSANDCIAEKNPATRSESTLTEW